MKNLILLLLVIAFTNVKGQYQVGVSVARYVKNGKPAGQIFDGVATVGDSIAIGYDVNTNMIPSDTSVLIQTHISNYSTGYSSVVAEKSWNYLLKNKWALCIIPFDLNTNVYQYDISVNYFKVITLHIKPSPTATETPTTAPDKEFTFYSILGTNKTTCKFTDLPSGLWVCEGKKYLIEYK